MIHTTEAKRKPVIGLFDCLIVFFMEKRFSDSIEYIMKHDPITDKRIGSKGVFFRLPHWAGVQ